MNNIFVIDKLIRRLADGKFHSGEAMAQEFKLTRAAVWKQIGKLKDMGLEVDSVRGRGYRVRKPLDLLEQKKIELRLSSQSLIQSIEVLTLVDSTSHYLKQLLQFPERRTSTAAEQYFRADSKPTYVCIAEYQSAGRGRRGREWHAALGSSVCFSLLWRFENSSLAMSGLSLALGVSITRALHDYGIQGVGLKWPNDLYWQQKKLGGILFEVFAEQGGDGYVIAGVGLNLDVAAVSNKIDQAWTDLSQAAPQKNICRNTLAAILIEQASIAMKDFSQYGFEGFIEQWKQYDICSGQAVNLHLGEKQIKGIARGVDMQGRLIVDTDQGQKIYASGEVSLRFE